MKKPKLEPLPARSDEMMAWLAAQTPVEVRIKGQVYTTTLSKLAVGKGERK